MPVITKIPNSQVLSELLQQNNGLILIKLGGLNAKIS